MPPVPSPAMAWLPMKVLSLIRTSGAFAVSIPPPRAAPPPILLPSCRLLRPVAEIGERPDLDRSGTLEHFEERLELVEEVDDDLLGSHRLDREGKRVRIAEDDGMRPPRRGLPRRTLEDRGDLAGGSSSQVGVLADDEAVESPGCDAADP